MLSFLLLDHIGLGLVYVSHRFFLVLLIFPASLVLHNIVAALCFIPHVCFSDMTVLCVIDVAKNYYLDRFMGLELTLILCVLGHRM